MSLRSRDAGPVTDAGQGKISTAYFVNASLITPRSAVSGGLDKSTSPISAAKLGVIGQTLMVIGCPSKTILLSPRQAGEDDFKGAKVVKFAGIKPE